MAHSEHTTEAEFKEHFDTPEDVLPKVKTLARWIKRSRHFIAFTGAGVSTACGISDFRSGVNTVLKTGAGACTEKAAVKAVEMKAARKKTMKEMSEEEKVAEVIAQKKAAKKKAASARMSTLSAIPSATHMSLIKLYQEGYLKYLISQNCNGLHRRSGFPPQHMSELHGNINLEFCLKCGKEYMRDYRCRNGGGKKPHTHLTGRKCSVANCGGDLQDTLICFSEDIPKKPKDRGFENANEADLCLVIGSSCKVTPACKMPEICGRHSKKRLVIVNLQATPLDEMADIRINGKCEDVVKLLMEELELPIPEFRLTRYVKISKSVSDSGTAAINVEPVDSDGTSMTLMNKVVFKPTAPEYFVSFNEPFKWKIRDDARHLQVILHFVGHYEEPPLSINLDIVHDFASVPSPSSSSSSSGSSSSSNSSSSSSTSTSDQKESCGEVIPSFIYKLQFNPRLKLWKKPSVISEDMRDAMIGSKKRKNSAVSFDIDSTHPKRKRTKNSEEEVVLRRSKRLMDVEFCISDST